MLYVQRGSHVDSEIHPRHSGTAWWGEGTLIILTLGFLKIKVLGNACSRAVGPLSYRDSEVLIWLPPVCLGAVDRGVDLKSDVKLLSREEILLVRRQDATERRARAQALEVLGMDGRE